MYDVPEIGDYKQKWLEAERDLALNWAVPPPEPFNSQPTDLEDHQPGASQDLVLDALKKVTKSPKPSEKHSEQLVSASKET